jgi:hypothetical protein
MPNYKLIKTLITPLENYLEMDLESQPPSYHIQQYHPSCCDPNPMWHKPTASSLQPYNYKYYLLEGYPIGPLSPTPLNPMRRKITVTATMTMTKGALVLQFHSDHQSVSWFEDFVRKGTHVSDIQRGECSQYDCGVVVYKLWNSL